MVTTNSQRGVNGAIWLASGLAVILVRLMLYQDAAPFGWLVLGGLMMTFGFYQVWRFQKTRSSVAEGGTQVP